MKFLRSSLLVAAAVAVTTFSSCTFGAEAGLLLDEVAVAPYHLRRDLAGSNADTPAPSVTTAPPPTPPPTPAPTPAPTPPPPAPTTSAPAPTTTAPAPTTPAPTTTSPVTTSPATTAPATTAPATTAPSATTASPTNTPEETTDSPATTKPATSGSTDGSTDGAAGNAKTPTTVSPSDADTSSSKSSKMSTGTIIGIVCGIVGGVAILAIIAVVLARRRRNDDDDPLSPFELSMDKGYSGVPVMQNANQYGNNNNANTGYAHSNNGYGNANNGYTNTNNSAMIGGAAAVGAGVGVGAAMLSTNTPQAGSDAAGVSYTQFYDVVTSPGSAYPQRLSSHTDDNTATNNDSNLWMSAMEPKENSNDVEGASVPPEVSLPGDEYDDNNSSFISRNSYDQIAGSESIDIDQSSVLSGGSDLEKEFPDYEDDSSRGSYEL